MPLDFTEYYICICVMKCVTFLWSINACHNPSSASFLFGARAEELEEVTLKVRMLRTNTRPCSCTRSTILHTSRLLSTSASKRNEQRSREKSTCLACRDSNFICIFVGAKIVTVTVYVTEISSSQMKIKAVGYVETG